MSILLFLAVLFVLVLVHELGHFAVAKWTKMRVDEFGIGFPPKLFGIKKGETEYTFNLLPIGGFVKIFGEDGVGTASSPAEREASGRQSEAGAESGEGGEDGVGDSSARPASVLSEQGEGENRAGVQLRYGEDTVGVEGSADGERSFTSKSKWAQAAVLIAGVSMNVLFAWLLMVIVFSVGVNTSVSEAEAGPEAQLTVTQVLEDSPAGEAKLEPGAVIQSVQADGVILESLTPTAFSDFIANNTSQSVVLTYSYGGELYVTELTPQTGIIESDNDKPAIGVALTQIDVVKRSLGDSAVQAFIFTGTGLRDITVGITMLLTDALRLDADFSQIAGPVGIVGLVGEASAYGLTTLLMFTAFISLNLAIINILPFPALDGGRLLLVGVEAIRQKPINPQFVSALNSVGFLLLILLMVAVTWNDIARLI